MSAFPAESLSFPVILSAEAGIGIYIVEALRKLARQAVETTVSREPGTVVPGENGWYFAGFVGAFPAIASNSEQLTAPVNGTLDSLAQSNAELSRYLYNDVKVCVKCGRPCANTQKACQACGTSLADVPVTQTENVMMGFIFGVERTLKLPLMISLRRTEPDRGQTNNVIVFDDLLAMSSCHLNALLTSHYCQDWRWLLRDPVTARGLLDEMVHEAWQATLSFWANERWRKFVYREGVTPEMVAYAVDCFAIDAISPSDALAWLVQLLRKLFDGLHAQRGRWFPLEYVSKILDVLVTEGNTFDVKSDTSVDEIIQYFNKRGVYYEEVWAERYQTYCKSYSLSNWQAEDFKYVVFQGKALPDGRICVGEKLEIDPVSLHHEDKLLLQNYGRRMENDRPGGTYYKHHKALKIGDGIPMCRDEAGRAMNSISIWHSLRLEAPGSKMST
eukprot:s4468_g5.t1